MASIDLDIHNPLLYGYGTEKGVVGVHPVGDDTMRMYMRGPEGVTAQDAPFYPFFFLSDATYMIGYRGKYWVRDLSGKNYYRFLYIFTTWSGMWDAVRMIIDRFNERTGGDIKQYVELPILYLRPEPVTQFLLQTGITHFKGMEFEQLHRMQLDIETYTKGGKGFSNANRPEDKIIIVAVSDNRGWEKIIDLRDQDEKALLLELTQVIRDVDPDVIEGHNLYNFDLPYILTRCERHGVEFTIGRDGTVPRGFDSRMSFAERTVDYVSYEIAGRNIIDTWLLVQAFDVSKRTLESYSLKYAAQYFGIARPERTYIEGKRISWYWDNDPETLIKYALDDVQETRQLSDRLSPSMFYLSQLVPMAYGTVARSEASAKIENLLLREYVREKHSLPKPQFGTQTSGGYTDIYYTGVLGPIVHCDVESLYPSIMLTENITPKTDELEIFQLILKSLTRMRLDAKRQMKTATDKLERSRLDAMQSSYKILINSFYGYLGYVRGIFNDFSEADRVTQTGQKILRSLIGTISDRGGLVIEVDTDGVFFVPPPSIVSEEQQTEFVRELSKTLPDGINLGVDGRYRNILSYKKKNYALEDYSGGIKIRGSSLISRSMEKFGRKYVERCIRALLAGDIASLHNIYVETAQSIMDHKLTTDDFAKTESLKMDKDHYLGKIHGDERNRAASYEAAIAAGIDWKLGEKISYYITGSDPNARSFENCRLAEVWDPNFPDENSAYYLRRLDELSQKFTVFFTPPNFRSIFSMEDLFGFDPVGIQILTLPVQAEELPEEERFEDIG